MKITTVIMLCLSFCMARADLVSTSDWNTNADNVIAAYEKKEDIVGKLTAIIQYNGDLYAQADAAERKDERRKQETILIVVYFNLKLTRQILIDNKDKFEKYAEAELEGRRLTESIRRDLYRLGYRYSDSLFASYYFKEYRKSFRTYNELILRAP